MGSNEYVSIRVFHGIWSFFPARARGVFENLCETSKFQIEFKIPLILQVFIIIIIITIKAKAKIVPVLNYAMKKYG